MMEMPERAEVPGHFDNSAEKLRLKRYQLDNQDGLKAEFICLK